MIGVSLALLLWINAVAMMILVKPVAVLLGFTPDPMYLSVLLSLIGIVLGFTVFGFTYLPHRMRRYLKIGLFTGYPLLLLITYLIFDLKVFFEIVLSMIKLLLVVLLCSIPLMITYGILKKSRVTIVAPSLGMISLFFLTRAISGSFAISVNELWLFILFFLLYLLFLELTTGTIYFSSIVEKITPQKHENEFLLERFTLVFHSYILYLTVSLILCFVFTESIVLLKDAFLSANNVIVFGVNLRSLSGLYLCVVLTSLGVFLFWLLAPMRKTRILSFLGRSNKTKTK